MRTYCIEQRTQYSVKACKGKESKKGIVTCIHVTDSLCCIAEN